MPKLLPFLLVSPQSRLYALKNSRNSTLIEFKLIVLIQINHWKLDKSHCKHRKKNIWHRFGRLIGLTIRGSVCQSFVRGLGFDSHSAQTIMCRVWSYTLSGCNLLSICMFYYFYKNISASQLCVCHGIYIQVALSSRFRVVELRWFQYERAGSTGPVLPSHRSSP